MGRIRDFLNRHNLRLYKCERCGTVEAPFLDKVGIGDYGWYRCGDRFYCHKCIKHPGIIDVGCVQRHNKFIRIRINNSRYAWLFTNADFGIE